MFTLEERKYIKISLMVDISKIFLPEFVGWDLQDILTYNCWLGFERHSYLNLLLKLVQIRGV